MRRPSSRKRHGGPWKVCLAIGPSLWAGKPPSARARPEVLREQFREDVKEGLLEEISLDSARRKFGDRLLMAACVTVPEAGTDEFRIVFDSNEVHLNHRICVRDLLRRHSVSSSNSR